MKKRSLLAVAFLFLLVAAFNVQAADPVDMSGKWEMEVTTKDGTGNPTFDLKQEGDALTGIYSGRFGEEEVTGKVEGNTFVINYESSGIPVKYSGTIDGDTVKGEVDFSSYGTGTFTGKR